MLRRPRAYSLRVQLLAVGLMAILLPLALLLAVVFASVEESETSGSVVARDGSIEVDDDVTVTVEGPAVPPVVPITAGLLALPAIAAVWWWSRRAVEPIEHITMVANEIQAGSLDRRIGLGAAPVEVQSLANSFDQMLDRLATASETQRKLIEDTNHELRTPLAALAVNTEVMLRAANPSPDEYRASAERSDALVRRIQSTVDGLLSDARARHQHARQIDNDLMAIIDRVVQQQLFLTPDRSIDVGGPSDLHLGIDGPSIERALSNLLDNAVRYSPAASTIDITVEEQDDGVHVAVRDRGPGIDPVDVERVFDRYFRADAAPGEGTGIGLALVKQVAEAHGRIEVESPLPDGGGTRFTMIIEP